MKFRNSIGSIIAFVTCSCTFLIAPNGWTQEEVITDLEKRGRAALESKQYSTAQKYFSEGATKANDPDVKARLDFRQAVTLQQMATAPEVENPEETLMRAARLYHSYLKQNPDSTAAANNLAKIYETLGNAASRDSDHDKAKALFRRADAYYQKAITPNNSSQALYLKNYAEFLERKGDWKKAKETYAQLIKKHPVPPTLQESLARTYLEHGLDDLADYLWKMLDAGYVSQSGETALDTLLQSLNVRNENRVELLTIFCAALAQGTEERSSFTGSDLGRQFNRLRDDSYLGEGAEEVYQLFQGQTFDPDDYNWWASNDLNSSKPDKVLSPIEGFRALIRSLGSRSKRTKNMEMAESYFNLAAKILPSETDPAAIRDLVHMYAEANRLDKIKDVLGEFKGWLYDGKQAAIWNSDLEKMFQYHQTLGELYALIGQWGDSNQVTSAVFQLEHARDASIEIQRRSPEELPETYQFTPQMVDMLSRAYVKTGRADDSLKLRIDQAETFNKAGNTEATRRVLAPVKATDLSTEVYKSRYEKLIINPELRLPTNHVELQRPSIEGLERNQR
jgi:tetratricopeptide (TPR) repeat protein